MTGYIKLHRKIRENPLFRKNPRARVLFEDILLDAAWKTTVQDWQGRPIKIGRGQLMMSQREMADAYGLTRQQLRTLLKSLESHNMLKINPLPNQGPTVITVCKYSEYQGEQAEANPRPNQPPTHLQPTKEEEEEVKKKEEDASSAREDQFSKFIDSELIAWVAAQLNPFAPEATENAESLLRGHARHYPPSQISLGLIDLRAQMLAGFTPRNFAKTMNGFIARARTITPEPRPERNGFQQHWMDVAVPAAKPPEGPSLLEQWIEEDRINAH